MKSRFHCNELISYSSKAHLYPNKILVNKFFFYSPWQHKRSQHGVLSFASEVIPYYSRQMFILVLHLPHSGGRVSVPYLTNLGKCSWTGYVCFFDNFVFMSLTHSPLNSPSLPMWINIPSTACDSISYNSQGQLYPLTWAGWRDLLNHSRMSTI